MQATPETARPEEQRTEFIGRVQEQRQFLMVLGGLLAHHHTWFMLAQKHGPNFDPNQAPGEDAYANIFLPHGIGGIGKSWLTRRCLDLAKEIPNDPPLLTLYDDVSLGAPVLEPIHLLDRLSDQLAQAGYGSYLTAYHQAKADTPAIVERVTRYQFENREHWDNMLQIATNLVQRDRLGTGYHSFAKSSIAYIHATGAEAVGKDAPTLAKAYDLLLERMQGEGKITLDESALFRNPPATQATQLVAALLHIASERPLVIGLDNLEIIVPLEPLIRDCLVIPTNHAPIIWILSGRHNLADERLVEINSELRTFKGYRDLLGENPPVVWDMSIFGDADLRDYLQAEAERRRAPLIIDDDLIEAVKSTSSGVPLVVEMVTDALFTMDRDEFLRDFALDDKSLLPSDRLDTIAERFLRYCLTQVDDLERVQAMALLRKDANHQALAAVWSLLPNQSARDMLYSLHTRYAFVLPEGLHDAVYEFVRRQLRTTQQYSQIRERLSRRAVDYYQAEWEKIHYSFDDPTLRVRDRAWQRSTRDLVNALLWSAPNEAVTFLLPRFVEGLGFDRPFSNGLLIQAEEFLSGSVVSFSQSYANLLHRMRMGLQDIDWVFDEPGEAIGVMVDILLDAAGLDPLHLAILHLWQGNWFAENSKYEEAFAAYLEADQHRPDDAGGIDRQLGRAFYELSSRFLWPESAAETVPSELGLQAGRRATELDSENGAAWFNLGVALDYLGREEESISAYKRAIEIEPRAVYHNNLGDVYNVLGRDKEALAAYKQAIEMDPAYAWPYHSLGLMYAAKADYEIALDYFQQAIDHHQRDKDRAISWDSFGDSHVALANYDEAISAYRWAGTLDPNYAPPWYSLGNVYNRLGQDDEAIEAYQKAIVLDPTYAWSYHNLGLIYARQGNDAAAVPQFRQAIERHEDKEAQAKSWIGLGDAYSGVERYIDAIEAYRQALALDPQQAQAWNNLGDVYHLQGNVSAAINAYQRAVQLDPDYVTPWNSLGAVYASLNRYDEAINAYKRVIKLEPDYAWPYNNLGFIYSKQGDYKTALPFYQQAIERHEDDESKAVSWSNLGDVQRVLGDQEEAIAAYERAISLAPEYAWPHHHLALVYEARGDDETAAGHYRQAIERHLRDEDRAVSWHRLADVYHRLERHGEAIDAYQKVLALDHENVRAWNSLGEVHLAMARYQEATNAFRQAIELDPDYGWPYHNLGLISTDYGAHESALSLYKKAIERHTDNQARATSLNKLGDTYAVLQNVEGAAQTYRQAIKLAPSYAWPYHSLAAIDEARDAHQSALTLYQQAIERHKQDKSRALSWNGLGDVYQKLNRLEEAMEAYQKATELDSIYAAPWNSLGNVHRRLARYDEAIKAYKRAIALDSANADPYHNLGLVYEARSEFETALTRFEQAIERYPAEQPQRKAVSWHHRGNAYQGLEQYESALDAYRQAVKLDPKFVAPWVSIGDVLSRLEHHQEAIDAYERAVDLDPSSAVPWNSLGNLYRILERFEEAISAYQRAIELDPNYAWPYHNLGLIDEKLKKYGTAINFYEQAIKRHQQPVDKALSWNGLGNIYRIQGRNTQAIEAYQQAIELDPTYAWPYHSLGLVRSKQGQYESAIILYQQAIERHESEQDKAVVWKDLGEAYALIGRGDEAIEAFGQAMEFDPDYALPWHSLGNLYRTTNRYEQALSAYRKAIELDSTYAWSYNNLGLVHEQLGEYDIALRQYQQAIERHATEQDKAISWINLGNVYYTQKQYAEAHKAYQWAIHFDPNNARAWNSLGDILRAQGIEKGVTEAYQRAVELGPSFAWPYHNLGTLAGNKEAYIQAITYFQQALERHLRPIDKATSWNGLGNVYRAMNRYDLAIDTYQKAIELNPDDGWPYHNLGFVYKNLESYHQAITSYQRAIERFATNEHKAVSWNNLGNVYSALDRNRDAIGAYEHAIDLNPAYALPWNSLGEIYNRLDRSDDAIKAFRQAIERDSKYVAAWNNLGDIYRRLRRFDESIAAYEQAIKLDSRFAWPYHNLGLLYEERGDYESATKYYQEAIERHQNNAEKAILWDNIGSIYRLMGETAKAIEAYHRATALDPNYTSPWYSLGNIYAALDKHDQDAINAYRQAIALNSGNPWPYHNLAVVYDKREQYGQSIALYQQAIERHTNDLDRAVSWDSLGNVYSDSGRFTEARQAFEEAIRLNPKYALPWNSLGDVYSTLGDHRQAINAYQQAIALDPSYAWPYNNLGLVYENMGEYQQAIDIYKEVINLHLSNHDRAISWNSLGDVYRELQRETEAIAAYEQAIKLDPDYAWPYNSLGAIYEKQGAHDEAFALYQQAARRHRQRSLV